MAYKDTTWADFIRQKAVWRELWNSALAQAEADIKRFMAQSELVIMFPAEGLKLPGIAATQMPFTCDAGATAYKYPRFFVPDSRSKKLISLAERYAGLADVAYPRPEQQKEKNRLQEEIKQFLVDDLPVIPAQAELRFPTLDMALIRRVKQLDCCDPKRTCLCDACIRATLRDR